jgi:hypothetical protein
MKVLAALLALLCIAIAALYWTGALQFATSHPGPHHTHAIVLALVGVLALVWLRFQSAAPRR